MHRISPARFTLSCAFALTSLLTVARPAAAQMYPFSQRGTVGQTLAFTDISIEYGRPTARGRELFGALVPWDSIWHPGADEATTITIAHDVEVNGSRLPAGSYTMWLLPRSAGSWTFIFSRATGISHTPYPGVESDALRLELTPDSGDHVEALTYSFPMIQREEATLRLQWGTRGVNLRIRAPYRPDSPD